MSDEERDRRVPLYVHKTLTLVLAPVAALIVVLYPPVDLGLAIVSVLMHPTFRSVSALAIMSAGGAAYIRRAHIRKRVTKKRQLRYLSTWTWE